MAVSNTDFVIKPTTHPVNLNSIQATWTTVISAGGMDDTDNSGSTIDSPAAQITDATRFLMTMGNAGTSIILRLQAPSATTLSTSPVIQVFGLDPEGSYMRLEDGAGNHEITLALSSLTDGTDVFGDPRKSIGAGIVDCMGCTKILVGVKTAAAVSAGSAANILLQGKVI